MAFLSDLGNVINEQFSFGENSVSSLDSNGDRVDNFGLLGDFAKKFDQTAERTYIEDGLINNIRPRQREILFQEPEITLIIKKRMFSSLIENSRLELMEDQERLFIRASKKLFQNKCRLIAIYERLSKVERVTAETGQFNTALIPVVLTDLEQLERAGFGNIIDAKTRSVLDQLRQATKFAQSTNFTTWVSDADQIYAGDLGEGTGVMELTTMTNITTKVSTDFGGGSCQFSLEDPYKIMRITNKDIDQAITDSQNMFKNSPLTRLAEVELTKLIDEDKARLNIIRTARGVSPIRFIISPQSIISTRVRAIREAEGIEVNFDYNSGLVGIGSAVTLDDKETEGVDGLNEDEERLFKSIISNIFQIIGLQNTTQSQIKEFNQSVNYARNKLRLMFKGKSIINHMDIVNVFMTTRTTEDSRLTEGFPGFQGSGEFQIGQKINNLVRNINSSIVDLSGTKTSPDEAEKAAIVGKDFPTWLWRLFRNSFTSSSAGTAVFVGIVKDVTQKYEGGKYTVSVDCEDNTGYFTKSQVNVRPSLVVFNSNLYDPLTPFNVSFDAATGKPLNNVAEGELPPLLPENQELLQTRALKFTSTDFKGQNANQVLYNTKKDEVVFGRLRRVLADGEGFVYRWKQGIGTYLFDDKADASSRNKSDATVKMTASPFAGQDVMNVLSLLIAGVPYNYNAFIKAAKANDNSVLAYSPTENRGTSASYLSGLVNDLSERNVQWGNFVPFKSLSVNESAFKFLNQGQADLTAAQSDIQELQRRRAALIDTVAIRKLNISEPGNRDKLNGTNDEIAKLSKEIEEKTNSFVEAQSRMFTSKPDGSIKLIGDDISFEPGFDQDNGSDAQTEEERILARTEMRKRINALTLRRLWKVKGNNDNNFLIVDDQYDKNLDLQAFERRIDGSLELFNSDYITVDDQIKEVAKIIGLEVFADSQGHIRIRPPLYNRVPSSVFYKMFKDREQTGVKVFPDFLETLLFNQSKEMTDRLEIIEDEIRLRAVVIGIGSGDINEIDTAIEKVINSGTSSSQSGSANFSFLTDPTTGSLDGEYLQKVDAQSDPEKREQAENNSLQDLQNQTSVNVAFDIQARVAVTEKRNFIESISSVKGDSKIELIRQRLQKNKGYKTLTAAELLSNKRTDENSLNVSALSALNVVEQIGNLVAERQKVVKSLANTIRNLNEGLLINADDEGAKSTLTPFLNRKTAIPPLLEYMLEDETIDDLGVGSGNRFIIKENMIVSRTYTETPPPYTSVQVNGLLGEGFISPPGGLDANLPNASGGNQVVSAYAVDYDMWYQYGFRSSNSVPAPWASDPKAQCAPYAVYLLNRARKEIFGGTVTVMGYNEYYQPGDVVYIEDDDMLFYVSSVSHSFNWTGPLQTTLTLTYGHSPGEYIPTPLDLIGKHLYSAQGFSEKYKNSRFKTSGSDISLGSFIITGSDAASNLTGPNGKRNREILSKLLYGLSGAINRNVNRNERPKLELRVYSDNGKPKGSLGFAAPSLRRYLISPEKFSTLNSKIIGDTAVSDNFKVNESDVRLRIIDIDNGTNTPSADAWNLVRLIRRSGVPGSSSLDSEGFVSAADAGISGFALDDILQEYIIDAWVVFEPVQETTELSSQENQASQEGNAKIEEAQKASRNAETLSGNEGDPLGPDGEFSENLL